MELKLFPGTLRGSIAAIPSKSQAHRILICAALSEGKTEIRCPLTSQDMDATVRCLRALGTDIHRTSSGWTVRPIATPPMEATLDCGESGSTLRFLLPVVGALGVTATFLCSGRLAQRPLSPLWEEMERMGCQLRSQPGKILCRGQLRPGEYRMAGNVSSQFFTGLLLAFPLLHGTSRITLLSPLESRPYVELTEGVMGAFGVPVEDFSLRENRSFRSPGFLAVEGDWSNGAFWLAANALGSRISVTGLSDTSLQGDRVCRTLFTGFPREYQISAENIPDLIPILAVVAAMGQGGCFLNIRRLRLKESDRVEAVTALIRDLGGRAKAEENTLSILPIPLRGGRVDACNDHRIAMAAAIAATVCREPVILRGAEAVQKSYPGFWEDYRSLGGHYEQYLR